jgi:tetratricopeptide (TPR) repeat protein
MARCSCWYRARLSDWNQDRYQALHQFETEHANILAVIEWCLSSDGDVDPLPDLMDRSRWFLLVGGQWGNQIQVTKAAIARLQDLGRQFEQCGSWKGLGTLYYLRDDHAEAVDAYTQGLQLARSHNEYGHISSLGSQLAQVYANLGEFEQADRLLQEAERAAQITQDLGRVAAVHRRWGRVCLRRNDAGSAEEHFRLGLELQKQAGAGSGDIASAQWWLGAALFLKGDLGLARTYLEEGLGILVRHSHTSYTRHNTNLGGAKKWLALLEEQEGNLERAAKLACEALEVFKELGMRSDIQQTTDLLDRLGKAELAE